VYASTAWSDRNAPEMAIDDRTDTLWASGPASADPLAREWLDLQFMRNQHITKISLISRQDSLDQPSARANFNVYGVDSNGAWTLLGGQGAVPFPVLGIWTITPTTTNNYVRVVIYKSNNDHINFSEVQVYSDN
jgi:hypothetical protein